MMTRTGLMVAMLCAASHAWAAPPAANFDVQFSGCTEYVGIGLVPMESARPWVPDGYALITSGENAIMVVRVADCASVQVGERPARASRVAQVGLSVHGLDATADINNYTLWYATDDGQLRAHFAGAGVDCDNDQQLSFQFTPGGSASGVLDISVSPPQGPSMLLQGSATEGGSASTRFVATWWADGSRGVVRMRTEFPQIRFSGAAVTLNVPASSDLSALIGGATLQFALLDSYNAFDTALMEVRQQAFAQ